MGGYHDNKSQNKSSESIGGAALIRGWRLLTFLSQMRGLFEGGAYSSTGKYDIGSVLVCIVLHTVDCHMNCNVMIVYHELTTVWS